MIISHRHRFIFIKTRKTAGTSIEISLSRYCGPEDVITPITLADEPLRGVLGLAAQNYLSQGNGYDRSVLGRPVRQALLKLVSHVELRRPDTFSDDIKRRLSNHRGAIRLKADGDFYNHMRAADVIRLIGPDVWNRYYRFCFEREPIPKVLSDYRYRGVSRSFDEYLRDFELPLDYDKYYVNGELAVDFVGRHERLAEDLTTALANVGISFDGWLPRAKARGDRSPTPPLTTDQRGRIEQAMADEYARVTRRS